MNAVADSLRAWFSAHEPQAAAAWLFGSEARGTARPDSDVDVAVLYAREPPHTLEGLGLDVEGALEAELKRRVQVIVANRAPADLVHRILRDGVLLLDRDPSTRIRFEVDRRNEYWDLLPMLREYRRAERKPHDGR